MTQNAFSVDPIFVFLTFPPFPSLVLFVFRYFSVSVLTFLPSVFLVFLFNSWLSFLFLSVCFILVFLLYSCLSGSFLTFCFILVFLVYSCLSALFLSSYYYSCSFVCLSVSVCWSPVSSPVYKQKQRVKNIRGKSIKKSRDWIKETYSRDLNAFWRVWMNLNGLEWIWIL